MCLLWGGGQESSYAQGIWMAGSGPENLCIIFWIFFVLITYSCQKGLGYPSFAVCSRSVAFLSYSPTKLVQ